MEWIKMEIAELLDYQSHCINLLYQTENQRHDRLCELPEYHQRTQSEDAGVILADGELDVELRTRKFRVLCNQGYQPYSTWVYRIWYFDHSITNY